MSHYDVLGVPPEASEDEIRRAYRQLVRTYHPDRHAGEAPEVRRWAEERMRDLTAAWTELSDPYRRRQYDLTLRRQAAQAAATEPATSWQPYDLSDDIIDERLDDSHRPPPRGGKVLVMVPPIALGSGVLLFVLGIALTSRLIVALGAIGILLGVALFALASLSVIMESRHHDLH